MKTTVSWNKFIWKKFIPVSSNDSKSVSVQVKASFGTDDLTDYSIGKLVSWMDAREQTSKKSVIRYIFKMYL